MESELLAAWVQALATPLALLVLALTVRAGVQGKRTDVLIASHTRFDALMSERTELIDALVQQNDTTLTPSLSIRIASWGSRFWSLQFDQFVWWQHGFVDPEVFRYWMLSRQAEFDRKLSEAPRHEIIFHTAVYVTSWNYAAASWAKPPKHAFVHLIEEVRKNRICKVMKTCGPTWRQRLGLW
jgi:hypothetical protein